MNGRAVPRQPKLSARYQASVVRGDAVAFVGENISAVVRDAVAQEVVPLIDGRRTSEEIVSALAPPLDRGRVLNSLSELAHSGLVVEATAMPMPQAALWAELGVSEFRAGRLLAATTVAVQNLTAAPLDPLSSALSDLGFTLADRLELATVRLVICDDYLHPALATIDASARRTGQRWLPVKAAGVNVWVGPVFSPSAGPCWHCLADRLRHNRFTDGHRGSDDPTRPPGGHTRLAAQHAFSLAATTLAQWCAATGPSDALTERVTVLETTPLAVSGHTIRRRPQCTVCGDPGLALPAAESPDFDDDARPLLSRDGAERREAPSATFRTYAHLISPVTGVVSSVRPSVWNEQAPFRVHTAGHNHAFSHDSLRSAADSLRALSSGKGRRDDQARTSALCEALERYSGLYTGAEPRVSARLEELGELGLDPRRCMLFSERQYRERDRWLASGNAFVSVPREFDPNAELEWSPVWSLTRRMVRYLPTAYLFYGYPQDFAEAVAFADSNGNAAGVTRAEACLQGLYELVERDSVAIWWYNRIPRPRFDLSSLSDPWLDELQEFLSRMGRELWVLDLTSDLGVPTAAAISRRLEGPQEQIVFGFGAHHDAGIAISRAITEMCQFLPAALSVHPDGSAEFPVTDLTTVRWWQTAHLSDQPYLVPLRSVAPVRVGPPEEGAATAPAARFRALVDLLEQRGYEVLVLDQTRPDIGLSVVKIIVPGLRHFWARFAPGRLFDAPVALGWIPRPTPEDELNPVAMFI